MEEIEVGEYIRTKSGVIIKADFIDFERLTISQRGLGYDFEDAEEMEDFIKNEIAKHSKNIIDLIEVGDYVNGYLVRGKTNEKVVVDYYCYSEELAGGNWLTFYKDNIESIVTKEAFANAEYRVEIN